jgi:dCMP deaminase
MQHTLGSKWDRRFVELGHHVSQWSKDPSTKCGTVIVRPDRTIASIGYNGFARGIADTDERYANREEKYRLVVHAEMNAILHASESLKEYILYMWPLLPCTDCSAHIIQTGIRRVVAPLCDARLFERWGLQHSLDMFSEAGVYVTLIGMEEEDDSQDDESQEVLRS